MIKQELEKIISGESLTIIESRNLMNKIMRGEINNSQIASLLTALKCKGESPDEVAGFITAMRENSIKIKCDDENVIDVCGTGGDNSGTFNISTAVSFIVAGAGVKVAKHGNRSISSKCGSSDVLTELGIDIKLTPEQSEAALNEIGIAFLFAPLYHPSMKHVAPVRMELGMKTIFNILGPLTNPAGTKKQLIGTFNDNASLLMSNAAKKIGMEKVCFICTSNRFDEIVLNGTTKIIELNKGEIKNRTITNETFEYPEIDLKEIQGNSAIENANIIRQLFASNEKTAAFYVVCANAAMALYSANYSDDINVCKQAAEESILGGKAFEKLDALKTFGEKF